MSGNESPSGPAEVDRLYRSLAGTHSPLAAALITAAVTGEWPGESVVPISRRGLRIVSGSRRARGGNRRAYR